jgi:EAL and modified HD-GYP domain-containing signal transduction protein
VEPQDADRTPLIHVGRQAIYDRSGDVVAYELLFRDAAGATQASRRSAEATSRVIVAAFTEFGLEQLVDTRACFINVTREFLVGDLPVPFDSNQAVLEIVETVEVDDAVVDGVTGLIERGFTIALDDYQPGAHDRLLDLATYVKIDLLDADPAGVAAVVRRVRDDHPHIQLVAERLETEDDLQRAFGLGFDFFQGHVLGRPHVVSTAVLSPARLSRIRLLTALSAADVDFDDVVEHIAGDPALTYRLLQATNSAASGLSVRVSSVREAAVLLGLGTVRQWVTLMLLSDLAEASDDQLATVMTRARLCQTAAERMRLTGDTAFSVGLLSGVADMLGRPPAELAGELPLSADVTAALAEGTGPLGTLLTAVRRYEQGEPTELAGLLDPGEAVKAYLTAVGWCNDVMNAARTGPSRDPVSPRG